MDWDKQNKRWRYFAQLNIKELARRDADDLACDFCGAWCPREELHHYGRAASNDETVAMCIPCHNYFRRQELLHPAIKGDPRHPLIALGRLKLGQAEIREYFALQDRELGEFLIKLGEMYPDLEMPDMDDDVD